MARRRTHNGIHALEISGAFPAIWLWIAFCVALASQAAAPATSAPRPVLEAPPVSQEGQATEGDVSGIIQAAVDAAGNTAAVVKLPAGTWPLAKAIVLRSNIALEGDARGTILAPARVNASAPLLLQFPVGTTNVLVTNLVFEGGGIDFDNRNPLITATACTRIEFDGVTVRNSRGIGLLLQGGMKSSGVRNSRFVNLGNHWKTTLNKADRIQGLVFCCGDGNSNNFATGNHFTDIGLDALQIGDQFRFYAASNVFELANNQFDTVPAPDYPAGIFILHSAKVEIMRNLIHNAAGNGIDAPGLQESLLSNNVVSGCGGCGIGLFLGYDGIRQTKRVAVVGNTILDNVQWKLSSFVGGITIAGGKPDDIFISNNTVTDTRSHKTQAYGIQVREQTQVSGLTIDRQNRLGGNRVAALAGAEYATP
jgi:hypothetical protein